MVIFRVSLLCAVVAASLLPLGDTAAGAEAAAAPPDAATLRLATGDFVAGDLQDSPQPEVLRWQGRGFASVFEFAVSGVSGIDFPAAAQRPKPVGDYCFELAGGDLLFGSLVALSADEAKVDSPRFGAVHLLRANICRILRWHDGAALVYLGPNGPADWDDSWPESGWREQAGHLATDEAGATITGRFELPAQACIEFEVSWTAQPDFVLALGVGDPEQGPSASVEVWDRNLVILQETGADADVASLAQIDSGPGRAHFQVYLDQPHRRTLVFSGEGDRLADLAVTAGELVSRPRIRLINKRGDVRLEQLRITRWDGQPPTEVQKDRSRIHLADGSIIYGEVTGFDADAEQFIVHSSSQQRLLAAEQIGSIALSRPDNRLSRNIRAVFQDGVRLSGQLSRVEAGRLWLTCPGVKEPLGLPVAELRTLLVLDHQSPPPSAAGRAGRLEMDGVRLQGHLAGGKRGDGLDCLAWRPRGSSTASALRPDASARIVYRNPPPEPQATSRALPPPRQAGGLLGAMARALSGAAASPAVVQASSRFGPSLYLRTGDTIPCEVERIDERGVTFRSATFDATFVPHDKIKAVELENRSIAVKIDRAKRDRLLTLPRMQKDNPPTHLIRSVQGDYLRARLTGMDDKTLTVEVRLETRQLPRQSVSQIIWLHEDELAPDQPASPAESSTAGRVQALRDDGIRLTFSPEALTEATLHGTSDVLGPCRVALAEVDQLLIGGAIDQAAPEMAYQRWRLQHAVQPKFVTADDRSAARTPGADSALVGNPAPDFELKRLDGETFRLDNHRGRIIVLDFWATWCGPCIQAMPQIDRVVGEFEDRGVQLIAVNLQETPEAITATLQRLELKTTVVLDVDGAVAEKYAAVAIPQTVIIDVDGNVARVYVGGGPRLADQLREALQSLLNDTDQKTPANSLPRESMP